MYAKGKAYVFSNMRSIDTVSICTVINLKIRCIEFHPQASPYWLGKGGNLHCSILWGQLPNGLYIKIKVAR
jgi:hypothetical protein